MTKFQFKKFDSVLHKNGVSDRCSCTVRCYGGFEFMIPYEWLEECVMYSSMIDDVRTIDVRIDAVLYALITFSDGDFFVSKFWVDEHDIVRSEVLTSMIGE